MRSGSGLIHAAAAMGRFIGGAWRSISRVQFITAGLYGAVVCAMHVASLRSVADAGYWVDSGRLGIAPLHLLVSDEIGAATLLLAIALADRATGRNPRRRWPYIAAIFAAAAEWVAIATAVVRLTGFEMGWGPITATDDLPAVWTAYGLLEWIMLNGAATFIYLDVVRAKDEMGRFRNAESERAMTAKRLLESQLQAMQARVEPKFLFNTLGQVRRLYETKFALAEGTLDDLIAYLRAAMPQMRLTTSTVGQEADLARAYLKIIMGGARDPLAVDIRLVDEVARGRLPPMMLLPLIDDALARRPRAPASSGTLRIACDLLDDVLLKIDIWIDVAGMPQVEDEGVGGVRERLAALYGERGRLVLARDANDFVHTIIKLPFEDAGPIGESAVSAPRTVRLAP